MSFGNILALLAFSMKFCFSFSEWTAVLTVRYRKKHNWMMETVYSELNVGNFL